MMWYRQSKSRYDNQLVESELTLEQLLDAIHDNHDLDPSLQDMEASQGGINMRSNPFLYEVGKSNIPNENNPSNISFVNI